MKNKVFILGIVVIVAVIGFLYFRSIEEEPIPEKDVETIVSDDGKVQMIVPKAALPETVSMSDLSINSIASDMSFFAYDGEDPLATYVLSPNGLVLNEPVKVAMEVSMIDNQIPGLYHFSNNGAERIQDATVSIDLDGVATIEASISHFSMLVAKSDGFSVKLTHPAEAFVGEPFDVTAVISKVKQKEQVIMAEEGRRNLGGDYLDPYQKQWFDMIVKSLGITGPIGTKKEIATITINNPWTIKGDFREDAQGHITPKTIKEAPKLTTVKKDSFTQKATFTCEDTGPSLIIYGSDIKANNIQIDWKVPGSISMPSISFPITTVGEVLCKDDEEEHASAVSIGGEFTVGLACNNAIEILSLQASTEGAESYEIAGDIPGWLSFDPPSGQLPQDVTVNSDCNALQNRGPDLYTTQSQIFVFDTFGRVVNTIDLDVDVKVKTADAVEDTNTNISPPPSEPAISIGPTQVSFTYDHANPVCPLNIQPITIHGPAGSEWYINTDFPIWLSSANGMSGTVPAAVQLQFPCLLNEYKNQTQVSDIPFIVSTPDGASETLIIQVQANITNF